MDFIVYVRSLPRPGETVIGSGFEMQPGGKGANQAVAAARLGACSNLVSRVGGDYVGKLLLDNAAKNRVETSYVKVDRESHSGVAMIIVDAHGENVIAVAPGVDECISPSDVEEALPAIKESNVVIAQLEVPVETALRAMKLAKEYGKLAILNPAPVKPLPPEIYNYINIITPNARELEALTGEKIESTEDAEHSALLLLDRGVDSVIVTLGKRGALVASKNASKVVPAFDVPVVDTVGAGDAFNGALAFALAGGVSIEEAVTFANVVASLKVTRKGAQAGLPTADDVARFIEDRDVNLKRLVKLLRSTPG